MFTFDEFDWMIYLVGCIAETRVIKTVPDNEAHFISLLQVCNFLKQLK